MASVSYKNDKLLTLQCKKHLFVQKSFSDHKYLGVGNIENSKMSSTTWQK